VIGVARVMAADAVRGGTVAAAVVDFVVNDAKAAVAVADFAESVRVARRVEIGNRGTDLSVAVKDNAVTTGVARAEIGAAAGIAGDFADAMIAIADRALTLPRRYPA
jgi:hypothetical protein